MASDSLSFPDKHQYRAAVLYARNPQKLQTQLVQTQQNIFPHLSIIIVLPTGPLGLPDSMINGFRFPALHKYRAMCSQMTNCSYRLKYSISAVKHDYRDNYATCIHCVLCH